jgi:hypothetical protein
MLSVAPRNLLDEDRLTAAALNMPHRIQQENEESPERNELEPTLGELIVPARGPMAARADRRGALTWTHGDLDALVIGPEAGLVVDETGKTVATI